MAKIENGTVVSYEVGDATQHPGYIDVTNARCGEGWTDNNDGTFSPPPTPAPSYSGTNFMEALGPAVGAQLLASTDPVIAWVVKMFDTVALSGREIHTDHPEAQNAFDILEAHPDIPAFDAAKRADIEGN